MDAIGADPGRMKPGGDGNWPCSSAGSKSEDGQALYSARLRRRVVALATSAAVAFSAVFLAVVGPQVDWRYMWVREHCAREWIWEISSAQYQSQAEVPENTSRKPNASGRFGFFSEIAHLLRKPASGWRYANCICRTQDLCSVFSQPKHGRVALNGYIFELWLPAKEGGWVNEGDVANGREIDLEKCRTEWLIYAWPESLGQSGKQAYFMHGGSVGADLFRCHRNHRYGGENGPSPGVSGFMFGEQGPRIANGEVDVLGDMWVLVGC